MTTFRAFYKNQRVATGKDYKNNRFLQVYPSLKEFETRADWNLAWYKAISEDVKFVKAEEAEVPLTSSRPTAVPLPPSPPPLETSTKNWSYRNELTYTAPPGTYYIGDLCYALPNKIYDNVFGGRAYQPGFYSKGTSFFMVDGTSYGDGDYKGSDGHHYLVDAGIIGVCSADLIDPKNPSVSGGKIHTFSEPVEIRFNNGVFYFTSGYTHLEINTKGRIADSEEEED